MSRTRSLFRPRLAALACVLATAACPTTPSVPPTEKEGEDEAPPRRDADAPRREDATAHADASPPPGRDAAPAFDAATADVGPARPEPLPIVDAGFTGERPPVPAECPQPPAGKPWGVVMETPTTRGRPGDKLLQLALQGVDIATPKLMCGVDVRLFIPGDVRVLRGVFVKPSSTDAGPGSYADESLRDLGFGVLTLKLRADDKENATSKPQALGNFLMVALRHFAAATGRPEIAHLPFVAFGQSRGGVWSRDIAFMYPDRTIGYANVSGWVARPKTEEQRLIPALFVMGSETNAAEPWNMLRDLPVDYFPAREKGSPWTFALQWGLNEHSEGNEMTLFLPFFEALIRQRLPADADMRAGPVRLRAPTATPWLADRKPWQITTGAPAKAGEPPTVTKVNVTGVAAEMPSIAASSDNQGGSGTVWLPDRRFAFIWRSYMAKDPPVFLQATSAAGAKLANDRARRMTLDVGTELALGVAGALDGVTSVQYHDGDVALGAPMTAAPFTASWRPTTPGAHVVFAEWRGPDGRSRVTSPALFIVRGAAPAKDRLALP